jgi:hypothetical protein
MIHSVQPAILSLVGYLIISHLCQTHGFYMVFKGSFDFMIHVKIYLFTLIYRDFKRDLHGFHFTDLYKDCKGIS